MFYDIFGDLILGKRIVPELQNCSPAQVFGEGYMKEQRMNMQNMYEIYAI